LIEYKILFLLERIRFSIESGASEGNCFNETNQGEWND